jgi:hypothetical protein
MSPRLLSSAPVAGVLLFALFSPDASAVPPRIVGRPRITNPAFDGVANTMMYDVRVTVDGTGADADHVARVGYVPTADYTTCGDATVEWKWASSQTFDTSDTRTWSLYNFLPGTAYTYKIEVGDPSGTTRVKCGNLQTMAAATPRLPTYLGYLNLQYAKSGAPYDTNYVIFETNDCGQGAPGGPNYYIVAVDVDAETIVWYLDVAAMSGLANGSGSGFHYQEGRTPAEDRLLLNVGKRHMYEWAFDGTENNSRDFAPSGECSGDSGSDGPCVHHDVFKSDDTGNTYMLATRASTSDAMGTAWESRCGTGSRFLEDGFRVVDSNWDDLADYSLMADYGYDPTVDGGPGDTTVAARPGSCDSTLWNSFDPAYGVIEWTHTNSISASSFGGSEVIDLSLREWDQVLRFDATTGELLWRLSPNSGYSDWGSVRKDTSIAGRADFRGQHDVHGVGPDTIMMLDNSGDPTATRVLEIELDSAPLAARITKSWALVDAAGDPLKCTIEGTGQQVPGSSADHVLAMCAQEYAFVELDDPTGNTGTPPPLFVQLPDGRGDEEICTTGGPTNVHDIHGWHKAYPAARLGEF